MFGLLELLVHSYHDHDDHDDSFSEKDSLISNSSETPKREGLRKRKVTRKSGSVERSNDNSSETKELKRMGLITFIALFVHNIPEVSIPHLTFRV